MVRIAWTVNKDKKWIAEATLIDVLDIKDSFIFSKTSGSGCHPLPFRGWYFLIFKINWRMPESR